MFRDVSAINGDEGNESKEIERDRETGKQEAWGVSSKSVWKRPIEESVKDRTGKNQRRNVQSDEIEARRGNEETKRNRRVVGKAEVRNAERRGQNEQTVRAGEKRKTETANAQVAAVRHWIQRTKEIRRREGQARVFELDDERFRETGKVGSGKSTKEEDENAPV